MKKLLPFENITYRSRLSENEIYDRINQAVGAGAYSGERSGNTFKIKREIRYQNSFLPTIKGEIYESGNETIINIKMRLHLSTIIFMAVWFGVLLFAIPFILLNAEPFRIEHLLPVGMVLFGAILVCAPFKYESYKSKKDLLEILEAEIT